MPGLIGSYRGAGTAEGFCAGFSRRVKVAENFGIGLYRVAKLKTNR